MIIPFAADTTRESAERLFQILEQGHTPLPYNPKLPIPPCPQAEVEKAICLVTSGTTGKPKIAVTPISSHLFAAKGSNALIPLRPGDGWLVNLPLYHVSGIGILFRCMLSGAEAIFPGESKERVTHISCVPAQIDDILAENYPNLRVVLIGGSEVPKEALKKLSRYHVIPTYGMTEMCGQIASDIDGNGMQVLPHRAVRVVDGEIWVGGKTLFSGYLGETVGEWFPTGDLGELCGNRLRVTGRKDRLFISGGENIQPSEIEEALSALPGVISARVTAQKDPRFGATPVAYLTVEKPLCEMWLKEELGKTLIGWKIPSMFLQEMQ